MRKDHPRGCGENLGQFRLDTSILGSPPQVRGKPPEDFPGAAAFRITPAGAGKTLSIGRTFRISKDHPRRCGENFKFVNLPILASGSPPQVRGKLTGSTSLQPLLRITPAYAGKTSAMYTRGQYHEDHPRVCGENLFPAERHALRLGSPPRMRGKRAIIAQCVLYSGITPAYAGKTKRFGKFRLLFEDHPRVCGENYLSREGQGN